MQDPHRQLALAVLALAHGPLLMSSGLFMFPLMGASEWSPELFMIGELLSLCFAAFVAWLAFAVFDTNTDVALLPRRWRALGVLLPVWCVGQELVTLFGVSHSPVEHFEAAKFWMTTFSDRGELRLGWLAAAVIVAAAAEELVYRALLLRALESYMSSNRALILHALIFELVHAVIYGMGISGVPFIGGIVLGYAFQRTRSLAVPTLLHAGHNFLFFTAVWYFNR